MFNFFKFSTNSALERTWAEKNARNHVFIMAATIVFSMGVMIPLDRIGLGEHAKIYTSHRIFLIIAAAAIAVLFELFSRRSDIIRRCLVAALPLLFSGYYLFFTATAPNGIKTEILIGSILVHFFTMFMTQYFAVNNIMLIGVLSFGSLILSALDTANKTSHLTVFLFCVICGFVFALTRKMFFKTINRKFRDLSRLVPNFLAEHLSVSNETEDISSFFEPKERQSVCICADWRGFQKLTEQHPPQEVSRIIRTFYNAVYSGLHALDSSGHLYIDWWGDELFIVVYKDENESRESFHLRIAKFLHFLAFLLPATPAVQETGIIYDIGAAIGTGLVGLVGPDDRMKTTILGSLPGKAKRYQTIAKAKRGDITKNRDKYPVLVGDLEIEKIYSLLTSASDVNHGYFRAEEKDVVGEELFVCTRKNSFECIGVDQVIALDSSISNSFDQNGLIPIADMPPVIAEGQDVKDANCIFKKNEMVESLALTANCDFDEAVRPTVKVS